MTTLQPGENITLTATQGCVRVTHDQDDTLDINLTAFVLDAEGRAKGDDAVVFYNQPRDPSGSATFTPPTQAGGVKTHQIAFDIRRTPVSGGRIAITLTEDQGRGFAAARNLRAEVQVGDQLLVLAPHAFAAEKGVIVLELYLRNEQPKVKSVWQGFASGLAGLCQHYGVEVAAGPATASAAPTAPDWTLAPAPAPTPAAPPPAAPASKPVTLTKAGQSHTISLLKRADAPAEITVQAIWTDNGDGSSDNDDLDLRVGILRPDGRMQIVQAPERAGAFDAAPYVLHTGDVTQVSAQAEGVETVRVSPSISQRLGGPVTLVFSVYSAINNGQVSVASLKPRMRMSYGTQTVECAFDFGQQQQQQQATKKGSWWKLGSKGEEPINDIYTYVIGLIDIDQDSVVIQPSGITSARGSEATPWLTRDKDGRAQLTMDGPPVFKGEPLEPFGGKAYI